MHKVENQLASTVQLDQTVRYSYLVHGNLRNLGQGTTVQLSQTKNDNFSNSVFHR